MRPSLTWFLGICLLVPLVACLPPPVYAVQRDVRVPHAAAPLHTGEPVAGPVAVSFGMSNAADLAKPQVGNNQAAVEVPSRQFRGELRIRLGKRGEMALVHEHGTEGSSKPVDPTQAAVGKGDPLGTGFAWRYSAEVDEHFTIGIGTEMLVWSLPYVEFRTCIENCGSRPTTTVTNGSASAVTFGVGLIPSYHSGPVTLFGGVFVRNHPTIERKGHETGSYDRDEVDDGPSNTIVHAGVAYRVVDNVQALIQVTQDMTTDPVRYGPGVGFALTAAIP